MTALVVRANAGRLPLPDSSVDLVVTSPPYFALRSYTDGGEHYAGQIGSEPTPAEFLEALWDCTREWMRVLKPSGSIWVNLGDKYNAYNGGRGEGTIQRNEIRQEVPRGSGLDVQGIKAKSLLGLPWRYAIGCIDQLGLILRAEVIWDKKNGLPESVTDRVRRSHETWFHFTKMPRYYSAIDEIREPHTRPANGAIFGGTKAVDATALVGASARRQGQNTYDALNSLGKLPSSVWSIESGPWTGPIDFCPRCGRDLRAGNGKQVETPTDTACSGLPKSAPTDGHTDSPTSYGSAPFQTERRSTTYAATGLASDPTISNPSPFGRTSSEASPSQPQTSQRLTAPKDTNTAPRTPTSDDRGTESASCVCEIVRESIGPGSVWSVASEPLTAPDHLGVDHFAAFPTEFPRRIIQGWSPAGICCECGEGRRPVGEREPSEWEARKLAGEPMRHGLTGAAGAAAGNFKPLRTSITGYACACPTPDAPTRPSLVLDPFGGTGTTALCASVLGRVGISVDLSHDYSRLAQWRTRDQASRAKAMRVEKPPVQMDGQGVLFA